MISLYYHYYYCHYYYCHDSCYYHYYDDDDYYYCYYNNNYYYCHYYDDFYYNYSYRYYYCNYYYYYYYYYYRSWYFYNYIIHVILPSKSYIVMNSRKNASSLLEILKFKISNLCILVSVFSVLTFSLCLLSSRSFFLL